MSMNVQIYVCISTFLSLWSQLILPRRKQYEPAHEIMVLITQATSEGSGEPAHLRSLARVIAVRTHEVWK